MFRSAYRYLKFKLEDGLHVVARGTLSVYEPKGEYQLVCEHLDPHGRGALQLAFEQLKRKLQAEGLFDPARKRPIPALPRKIGIVTSLDGAALKDIIKVLTPAASERAPGHSPVPGAGRRCGRRYRRALKALGQSARRRRHHRRPRRRVDRGSLGVQRRGPRARDCRVPGAGDFRRRPRGRRDDCRLRRRPACADAVGGGGDGGRSRRRSSRRGSIGSTNGCTPPCARTCAGVDAAIHLLTSRRGLAGWHVRVAMQGRHVAELTHELRRSAAALVARRTREQQPAARTPRRDGRAAQARRDPRAARRGGRPAGRRGQAGARSRPCTRGSAPRRRGSTPSVRSPCSRAAMRSPGTATARRSSAGRPR